MAKAKAKVGVKTKKKLWYPILAPKAFGAKQIGETYQVLPEDAVGKTLRINLREFTDNMKDQNTFISFKIKSVISNSLNTEVIGYSLVPAFVKKLVKRSLDKIDDSFVIETSEKKAVRIKPLVLTRGNTTKLKNTEVRAAMKIILSREFKKLNFGNLVDKLIAHKLQNEMKRELSKVYPIRAFEIRSMGLDKTEA